MLHWDFFPFPGWCEAALAVLPNTILFEDCYLELVGRLKREAAGLLLEARKRDVAVGERASDSSCAL